MSGMDGAFSAVYALGQFFWGTLGDRYGTRRVVLFGMMASLVTAAIMGTVNTVFWMGVMFAFQGTWQASGWAPLGKNMGEFFSQRERGSVMGFWCTSYALGGFIASIIAGYAARAYGWRYAFFVPAGLLTVIWILDSEYGGVGDVFFDLANLAANGLFDDEQERQLLTLYFGKVRSADLRRLRLMRLASDMREAMWGFLQTRISKLNFDYQTYARRHLKRFLEHADASMEAIEAGNGRGG